jgi:L-cystine uptake protein TcyP (sodium:dicarboxylate symporter family)
MGKPAMGQGWVVCRAKGVCFIALCYVTCFGSKTSKTSKQWWGFLCGFFVMLVRGVVIELVLRCAQNGFIIELHELHELVLRCAQKMFVIGLH